MNNVLRTKLVGPVGGTLHLQRHANFMDGRDGTPTTSVLFGCVGHKLVQGLPVVESKRELASKGVIIQETEKALLVQTLDIDIRRNRIALRLGVRKPRSMLTCHTLVVDACATLPKGAVILIGFERMISSIMENECVRSCIIIYSRKYTVQTNKMNITTQHCKMNRLMIRITYHDPVVTHVRQGLVR